MRAALQGSEAGRVGRLCVLPQLLAAVLPCSGAGALAQTLRSLMMDASDEEAWALSHPTVRLPHTANSSLSSTAMSHVSKHIHIHSCVK